MRKQALLNLFMLLLVAGLAAVVLWGPEPERAEPVVQLTTLQADRVQRIEIAFAGADPVVLVRAAERWVIDNPQRWPADRDRIQRILALTEAVSQARYPLAELDARQVGLAPPRITLRLDEAEFAFGAQEPLNHYRYIGSGDQVHLVTDTVIHQLSDRPEDLVSRRLLPEGAQMIGLTLPGLTLSQGEGGAWRGTPAQPERSQDSFNAFIDGWRHARALRVESATGGDGEAVVVAVRNPERTLHFTRLADSNGLVLERSDIGLRYTLDATARDRLFRLPPTVNAAR